MNSSTIDLNIETLAGHCRDIESMTSALGEEFSQETLEDVLGRRREAFANINETVRRLDVLFPDWRNETHRPDAPGVDEIIESSKRIQAMDRRIASIVRSRMKENRGKMASLKGGARVAARYVTQSRIR